MQRRFGRFLRQGNSEGPQVPPALRQANQWMTTGNYSAAAAAFEDLAKQAERRSGPHAPFFFLQAGRARMLMDEYEKCMTHFKHGLTLLINSHRFTQLYRIGTSIVQELKTRGREAEAREIAGMIHSNTLAISETATQQLPSEKLVLPTHCPSCGGPLRSDEADWIDDLTAECPFCGSPVRAG
jgi:hypothetical protein